MIDIDTSPDAIEARTTTLLAKLRGKPDECAKLLGVVIMTNGMLNEEAREVERKLFNQLRIADRVDELRAFAARQARSQHA